MSATLLKRFFCLITALFFLAVPCVAWSVVEDFDDALSSDWVLFGSTTHDLANGWIQLTANASSQAGSIFYNHAINTAKFSAQFDVYCGTSGADGIVFAFVKAPGLGGGGGSMGFFGLEGYGVEFDTYYGAPHSGPESANHVGISRADPAEAFMISDLPYNLDNSTWFHAEVLFESGRLQMWMSNSSVGWGRTQVIDYTIAGWTDYDAYFGFTAATGGEPQLHAVDNFVLNPGMPGDPRGLIVEDIYGQTLTPGDTTYDTEPDTYTVTADGHDIWDSADDFRFVYTQMSGDFTVSACVKEDPFQGGSNAWAKGGIMVRQNGTPGSPFVIQVASRASGCALQWRDAQNTLASGLGVAPSSVTYPFWVRIRRVSNMFYGDYSQDGSSWSHNPLVAEHQLVMTDPVLVGICLTSHEAGVLTTTVFGDFNTSPPVLSPIGNKQVDEDQVLSFAVSASDLDGTIPTLGASNLPEGASFTDNADGTGSFTWTPTYEQAGVYSSVHFEASDGELTDGEDITITVNNVNRAPQLSAIGNKENDENVLLTFTVSASDPDGTTPALAASNLPDGASFTDNGNGTGSFTWTPTYEQAGVYSSVHFEASDGVLADGEDITITVNNVNRAPQLSAIGNKEVDENVLLTFTVSASDPDGTTPALAASNLPEGASFTDNGNGTGSFSWTPTYEQAGVYSSVHFEASDGVLADGEDITITVNNVNRAPQLSAIGNKEVDENVLLTFSVSASDPDGTTPALAASNLPEGASFTDNADGIGSFSWTPTYEQAGVYSSVHFEASDGELTDTEDITITVNNVNRAPQLSAIGNKEIDENVLLTFSVSASDPDGTTPALAASNLPQGASFTDNGNGTGSFSWTPTYEQAGVYSSVQFQASDAELTHSEDITITVNNVNAPPVLSPIENKQVDENQLVSFAVSASDPDGTTPALAASNLPEGASFTDNADGTGSFSWTPTYEQAGVYSSIRFEASDGVFTDSEDITITVNNVNRAPQLSAIGNKEVDENVLLTFSVSASDPDGTTPALAASNVPEGATFTDNADGIGSFSWTPTYEQAGVYSSVRFEASDGELTDSEDITITVLDAMPPAILEVTVTQAGVVTLSWQPYGVGFYTVEFAYDLAANDWQDVPGTQWPVSTTSWEGEIGDAGRCFFRVLCQ